MPDLLKLDLKNLVRVCLNDPDLRAEVFAAIDAGPLPIRTDIATVTDKGMSFTAIVKTNRELAPDDAGFIARDNIGWITARLTEVVATAHDSSTMSADALKAELEEK